MKKAVIYTVLIIIIIALITFNIVTVRRVSQRPGPAKPPTLNESPVRIYGVVEPVGKGISVGPRTAGVVRELLVAEGDTVRAGQLLCVLENTVQRAELETARARVALSRKAAELSRDEYRRNAALLADGSISESQYTQLKLTKELDEQQVALCEKELELARARLDDLNIISPRDGIIYLCDIRPGEFFGTGESERIVMGLGALQVRCDVEVIWIGRLDEDATYQVLNAETGEVIGTASYLGSSRYLRSKRFTTEDPEERMSARYQEVIMSFDPRDAGTPIRLPVMVELRR
jgi:multidrug efflux pump subunit AcrA (membrane-fusion protein)